MLPESPAALLTATAILIVAFIFFAIILRYGKTQIDKERLQTLYKNLYLNPGIITRNWNMDFIP